MTDQGAVSSTQRDRGGRYHRHHIEPGFRQPALARNPLIRIGGDRPDVLGDHLQLLAAVMGVQRQMRCCDSYESVDLVTLERALVLNPPVTIPVLPPELGIAEARRAARAGVQPFVAVDALGCSKRALGGVAALRAELPTGSVRYYAVRPHGAVLGSDEGQVTRAANRLGRFCRLAKRPGAHTIEGAAHVLGSYLAAVGAYRDPVMKSPMPPAPDLELLAATPRLNQCRRSPRFNLMIVGAGALGHAALEAILMDEGARTCLGELVVIDPDHFSESNLSRQTVAGGPHNLGRPKAVATKETFLRLWGEVPAPSVVAVEDRFQPRHLDQYEPDVIGLFTDNFQSRAQVVEAVKARSRPVVLCHAGTEFTFGSVRLVPVGHGPACVCFDCGEEGFSAGAREEHERFEQRRQEGGCGDEITSSNVLTNALAGAVSIRQLMHFWTETVMDAPRIINWRAPTRVVEGPSLPPCSCLRILRRVS
jgi:molybdopterin/thiamine biosynthesis adenylyltransferase